MCTAGRTRPYQDRSSWDLSRPQRRHKELRPMSSRRRTCGGRQHQPRSGQPDRRWFHGPPGVPDDRIAACAADSLWPPPVIYAPWASQHRRACRKDNASSRNHGSVPAGTLSSSNPGGLIRRLPPLTALRMPAGSFGFRESIRICRCKCSHLLPSSASIWRLAIVKTCGWEPDRPSGDRRLGRRCCRTRW